MPRREQQVQLDSFIDKFSPEIAARTRVELQRMRELLPVAIELVYDNYNALAIGFGPTERASEVIFSLAVYPRWVTLFFLKGAELADPDNLLCGSGSQVRHIRLLDPELLPSQAVRTLMLDALKKARVPLSPFARHRIVIKSVSVKQRPRR
ncbi:MAG: hypothetical protein ABI583_08710 [Betaproteobacteria bacterium]